MKAILFDFGGTLDTNGIHWSEKFWDAYRQHHVPVTKEEYEHAYVLGERALPGTFLSVHDGFQATLRAQVGQQFDALAKAGHPLDDALARAVADSCFADVQSVVASFKPLLEHLAQRYTLGVVSNFYGNLEASFADLGLTPFFRVFCDSTVAGIQKPDPRLFQAAIDALHVYAGETYVVGDSYDRDIVPAKSLGCVTVWLRGRTWKQTAETSKADYIILSLDEISRLLRM